MALRRGGARSRTGWPRTASPSILTAVTDPRLVLPTTPRLAMRRFAPADLPAMVAYRSHPAVARYQSWTPDWSMTDAEAFLAEDQATLLGTPGTWTQVALVERNAQPLAEMIAAGKGEGRVREVHTAETVAALAWMLQGSCYHLALGANDAEIDRIAEALTGIIWHAIYPDSRAEDGG